MLKTIKTALLLTASAILLTGTATAQTLLVKNAKVVTNGSSGTLENTAVMIDSGRVSIAPESATADLILDGQAYWVTPGIFAPFSQLGLSEVSAESRSNDIRSANKNADASIRAADSFNPKASPVAVSRLGGITHAAVVPGDGPGTFGGTGMIVSTSGDFDSILNRSAFVYANYNGKKGATMAHLRGALSDAANYSSRFNGPDDGDVVRRADAAALRPVVSGRIPLLISADRAVDLLNIVGLKSDYPRLDIILVGAAEGWMVADTLAKADVAVMVDPHDNRPASFDRLASRANNTMKLNEAGVKTAIISRASTGNYAHNLRTLIQHAGNAVGNGLDWDTAFKSITSTPASIFGNSDLGRINMGSLANLVVWDGDPLEITSAPIAIFIDGKAQSLRSRQTALSDRYNPTRTDDTPYGYMPQ